MDAAMPLEGRCRAERVEPEAPASVPAPAGSATSEGRP